jgi:hypothetical protein
MMSAATVSTAPDRAPQVRDPTAQACQERTKSFLRDDSSQNIEGRLHHSRNFSDRTKTPSECNLFLRASQNAFHVLNAQGSQHLPVPSSSSAH